MAGSIDEYTFLMMIEQLDVNHDGIISKEEFKVPYMRLKKDLTDAQYDVLWKEQIDKNGDGELSVQELAAVFGFNLSPNAIRKGTAADDMTDEQIMEALQMEAAMYEMKLESEARQAEKEAAKAAKKGGGATGKKTSSDKLKRLGVTSVRMAKGAAQLKVSPEVCFLQDCELGDVDEIKKWLEGTHPEGVVELRLEDDKGEMPLHKLARNGLVNEARLLLEQISKTHSIKVDLNWTDKQGNSPIFYAVQNAHPKLVQLLLDRGTDPLTENNLGHTILASVRPRNCAQCCAMLRGSAQFPRPDAHPRQAVNRVCTDMSAEFRAQRMEVIQKILEHPRADTIHLISHPDKGGRTVAHYAAIREEDGDDVLFKLLKKHGANFEAIDHGGNKPATLAAKAGRKKSKELLEEALVK